MKYPKLVYRSPGTHACPGGTYDYIQVKNEEELSAAAKAGYYPTPDLAVSDPGAHVWGEWLGYPEEDPSTDDEDDQATDRSALEARAYALGVKFRSHVSDATLAKRIAEAEE